MQFILVDVLAKANHKTGLVRVYFFRPGRQVKRATA
jgi:hypothetical protein